jgi:hypothetical protein
MSRIRGTSLALALVAVFGCAHGQSTGLPAAMGEDRLAVRVVNGTANNLRIYLLDGGAEVLIGRVSPLSETSLRIPPGVAGNVQLVARPAAGADPKRRHVSDSFVLDRGHQITWRLRASPGISDVPRASSIHIAAR